MEKVDPQLIEKSSAGSTYIEKPPAGSTFDKDGTIFKRRRVIYLGGALVVVVILMVVGLSVGLGQSSKKAHSSSSADKGQQVQVQPLPAIGAIGTDLNMSGAFLYPKSPSPVNWDDVHMDTTLVTVKVVDQFVDILRNISQSQDKALNISIPEPSISSASLILMLREVRGDFYPVLEALQKYARQDINISTMTPADQTTLVQGLSKVLSKEGINTWGERMYDRHPLLAMTQEIPSTMDMIKLAQNHSVELPMYTQNTTYPAAPSALNRKLLVAQPEWTLPEICVPVVFHILQYPDANQKLQPPLNYVDDISLINHLNTAFTNAELPGGGADTLIRFYSAEVRTADKYPQLRVDDFDIWNNCWRDVDIGGKWLFAKTGLQNADVTEHINVYVCGTGVGTLGQSCLDSDDVRCPPGYAWAPQENHPEGTGDEAWLQSHIHILWDMIDSRLDNRPGGQLYGRGGRVLAQLIGHHFGLWHPHHLGVFEQECVVDGDSVSDTATTKVVSRQPYFADLVELCDMWRNSKPWPNPKKPWTTQGGASLDKFDSCAAAPGSDPVLNLMELVPPSCSSYFTTGQVRRMWYSIPAFRPTLMVSGQKLHKKKTCQRKGGNGLAP